MKDVFEISGGSEIINISFIKHFIKRNKIKEQSGLTMIVDVDVKICIGDVELKTFTIQSNFTLSAEEFNKIRKLKISPSVAGGD